MTSRLKEKERTLLLIDAHSLIHRCYHALPPFTNSRGEPTGALYGLANTLIKIWREERPEYAAACFDRPEETERSRRYQKYKAQRPVAEEELVQQLIRAREVFRVFGITTLEVPGYEADDLIATAVEKWRGEVEIIILTGDFDATQLVNDKERVKVRTFKKGVSEIKDYDEGAVREKFGVGPEQIPDYKGLVGDASDNIKGVPGVGPKTAVALLREYGTIEEIYRNINENDKKFKKLIGQERAARESKELAQLVRQVPIRLGQLKELKTRPASGEGLVKLFRELGFNSLLRRLGNEGEGKELVGDKASRGEEVGGEVVAILADREASREEIKSKNIKAGFDLKEAIKKIKLAGPYFDLGVGFWLLDPDAGDYRPEYAYVRFMRRAWQGTPADVKEGYGWLRRALSANNLLKVFEQIEMPLLPVLAEMEETGIRIEAEGLRDLKIEVGQGIRELEKKIYKQAGEKFNLNSPKQLQEILFKKLKINASKVRKTAGGAVSTSYENLIRIREENEIIGLILKYREWFKIWSTYIEPLTKAAEEEGRVHTTYNQTRTGTGRLTSEQPNLQNIPQGSELAGRLRQMFLPDQGKQFLSFDYSQMELRILAAVTRDAKMIQVFREGRDVHRETAANVFNVEPEAVTEEMRRLAKVLNFGVAYGMGARAYAEAAGIEVREARKFIEEYFNDFSAIRKWQENVIREARALGYVQTMSGRRRLVPEIQSGAPQYRAGAERVAINMPIQGLGADIMKMAMVAVANKIKEQGWRGRVEMLLTIHDDLLIQAEVKLAAEAARVIKKEMEGVFELSVPLKVEVKQGQNWGEMKRLEI